MGPRHWCRIHTSKERRNSPYFYGTFPWVSERKCLTDINIGYCSLMEVVVGGNGSRTGQSRINHLQMHRNKEVKHPSPILSDGSICWSVFKMTEARCSSPVNQRQISYVKCSNWQATKLANMQCSHTHTQNPPELAVDELLLQTLTTC